MASLGQAASLVVKGNIVDLSDPHNKGEMIKSVLRANQRRLRDGSKRQRQQPPAIVTPTRNFKTLEEEMRYYFHKDM